MHMRFSSTTLALALAVGALAYARPDEQGGGPAAVTPPPDDPPETSTPVKATTAAARKKAAPAAAKAKVTTAKAAAVTPPPDDEPDEEDEEESTMVDSPGDPAELEVEDDDPTGREHRKHEGKLVVPDGKVRIRYNHPSGETSLHFTSKPIPVKRYATIPNDPNVVRDLVLETFKYPPSHELAALNGKPAWTLVDAKGQAIDPSPWLQPGDFVIPW